MLTPFPSKLPDDISPAAFTLGLWSLLVVVFNDHKRGSATEEFAYLTLEMFGSVLTGLDECPVPEEELRRAMHFIKDQTSQRLEEMRNQ